MKKVGLIKVFLAAVVLFAVAYGETEIITCTDCKGTGRSDSCWMCNGTGILTGPVIPGYPVVRVQCTACQGTKKAICFRCQGYGKIKVDKNPAPASPGYASPPAYQGGGSGGSERIRCNSCGGAGNCSACGGNYSSMCNYCDGRGSKTYGFGSNQTYETCATCKGSGRTNCAVCSGWGQRLGKCSVCHGNGYIQ